MSAVPRFGRPPVAARVPSLKRTPPRASPTMAYSELPPKKPKKCSPWLEATLALKKLKVPAAVPPTDPVKTTALRDARMALMRTFWPNVAGEGGRAV